MGETRYAVVVGGINMDIQGRSRAPFIPGDSNPGTASFSPGGVGRNIAENLVRLGLRTELVSVLGTDPLSEALRVSSASLGVGLSASLSLPGAIASQYLCLLDADGRLVGAVAAMENLEALLPEPLAARAALLEGAALLVLDANLPAESLDFLARRYGRGGGLEGEGRARPLLVLDPVSRPKAVKARGLLGFFDLVKPNRAEAELLAVRSASSEAELPGLSEALRAREGGPRELYISLGAAGLYFDDARGPERGIVRPPGLPVRNVSGAGDAACAALAWGALGGYTIAERASLAVSAAALAAAAESTVSAEMGPERLLGLAEGVEREPLS